MIAPLEIDRARVSAAFGKSAMLVRHLLADHPLLSHAAMIELAGRLPRQSIEHHLGVDLPLLMPDVDVEVLRTDPVEVARGLETNGCWLVLWHVERLPEYRALLDEILDEPTAAVEGLEGATCRREAFIFVSAPGTITPVHIDPEHNFLLQVRGTKVVKVGKYGDPLTAQLTAERYYSGAHRNIEWLPEVADTFILEPGDGVYSPFLAPHWVQNGPEMSISLSATFQTTDRDRAAPVHAFNARLRRRGLTPRPPGFSPNIDWVKRRAEAICDKASSLRPGERARRRQRAQEIYGPTGTRVR